MVPGGIPVKLYAATLILSLFVVHCGPSSAASPDLLEFRLRINRLYDFDAQKLNAEQFDEKLDKLDVFWKDVERDSSRLLPLLRAALSNPDNPPLFFYDGSHLLLSLSEQKEDRLLALRVMPKVDLARIQQDAYLRDMHWFACLGFDSTQAALRILDFPSFKAFIPQHYMELEQDYALIYSLFPMEESKYVDALAARLDVEMNEISQKSAILALYLSATPEGRNAIRKFSEDKSKPANTRTYARQLLDRKSSILNGIAGPFEVFRTIRFMKRYFQSSTQDLRAMRRSVLRGISDEALYEFNDLTEILLARQQES